MTIHSMKRGSRARRKAMLQTEAHNGHDASLTEGMHEGRDEGGATEARASANASALAASPMAASTPAGEKLALNGGTSVETSGGAPASTSVRTQERLPAPPPPPEAPDEPEEPKVSLLDRLAANLKGRATRIGSNTATRAITAWHFIRTRTLEDWAWFAVVTLAFVLRVWGIGDKPLHHDESMHAYFSYIFGRDPASYEYNPLLHGPFQFHAVGITFDVVLFLQWIFHLGGPAGNPWINDGTARIMPLLFGTAIVVLPAGLKRELGRLGALLAALLLAVSPAFVYFSRFLREDIYFNFFMFAMVVCAVRFARERETRWLLGLFAAAVCAYATFEGIFLTLAIFVGFLMILAIWELGLVVARALPQVLLWNERLFFSRAGMLLLLGAIGSALAILAMRAVHAVGAAADTQPQAGETADQAARRVAGLQAAVAQLEHNTVVALLWLSILVALLVIAILMFQMFYEPSSGAVQAAAAGAQREADDEEEDYYDTTPRPKVRLGDRINALIEAPSEWLRRRRDRLDPERQPFLWTLASVQWVQWFVAFVTAWVLFAALFWVVPPGPSGAAPTWGDGFQIGVGKGIWEGLYYWATQQDVARGGQPWYYYLLVIPLYEQLAVVFGLAGLVYALFRPTRFRLFLVWWFAGSLALYSWAGEKMPWLTIQILLPLMLLAAIALDVVIANARLVLSSRDPAHWEQLPHALGRSFVAVFGTLAAVLLLLPMVHSMWILSHQDAADGPHEMMVYVQTTTDVTTVMNKINAADQKMYHGQHQLKIAVGQQEEWPFYWYLRDYYLDPHPGTYATFDPPDVTSADASQTYDVLILLPSDGAQFMQNHPTGYTMHEYALRSWWDEAYKPEIGVGPYLSYGSNPPPGAGFDLGRAATRVWRWLWLREPLGSTTGPYFDFVLIVRDGVPIQQ